MSRQAENITLGISGFAASTPERPALICGRRRVSFAQLDGAIGEAATHFAHHGLRRGDVLPLLLNDPVGVAVAALGAIRMGASPMLLSPGQTDDQRRDQLLRVGARFLTTHDPAAAAPGLRLIPFSLARLPRSADTRLLDTHPEHPAMIQVGSGSTGEPLLIPVSHRNLHERNAFDSPAYGFRPGERFMPTVPMFFASALSWLLSVVPRGLTLVLLDPRFGFKATIDDARPDYIHLTVFHAHRLLEEADIHPDFDLSNIKQISVGASPVSEALRAALRGRLKARLAINYGTNETGSLSVAYADDLDRVPDTVGRPRSPVTLEIVTPDGGVPDPGDVGLIRVRGPGVIDHYVGGAAPERFRDGWFYPGDLGRWRDGQLVHCGRADHMMILDGINIYPAEIERCLERHPAVAEAAAFALPNPVHGQIPVCAVTLRPGAGDAKEMLMEFARKTLGLRHPRRIAILDSLPRNSLGKLKRQDLVNRMREANSS